MCFTDHFDTLIIFEKPELMASNKTLNVDVSCGFINKRFEFLKSKLLITFDLILCLNIEYLLRSKFGRVMEIGLFSWFFSDDNSSILRSFVKGWVLIFY